MIFLEGQKRIKANIIKRVRKEILMRNDRAKLPGGSKIASRSGINMPPSHLVFLPVSLYILTNRGRDAAQHEIANTE